MRKLYILLLLTILIPISVVADEFANENLKYKVEYKWGLVNKTAGQLNVKLNNRTDRYQCTLTGSTASWADKFFKVRDTLTCEIKKDGFLPIHYVQKSHEGDDYKYESVTYTRSGGTVTGDCIRKKWSKGKMTADEARVLTADGYALDMLSAFFFMRKLPYAEWTKGQTQKEAIFSGKKKETLTIKYVGKETVEVDKIKYECYHVKFTFTTKGGKKTSDDIDAWIETTGNHIPIKLEGSLPIGKIRCFYQH